MDERMLYAFRGWVAFVAFVDLGVAFRGFVEHKCFIGEYSNAQTNTLVRLEDPTLPRMLAMYSVLKAITLIHCTIFIHYIPVISVAIFSILLTIVMYLTEALYFKSATVNFYIIFPCVLNGLTMIGLMILPMYLMKPLLPAMHDENEELLKQVSIMKRKKHAKNKYK